MILMDEYKTLSASLRVCWSEMSENGLTGSPIILEHTLMVLRSRVLCCMQVESNR